MKTALNGFEKTEIWPVNPGIFRDLDFLPSITTEIELECTQTDATDKDMASTTTTELSQIQSVEPAPVTIEENCHAHDLDIHASVVEANAGNDMHLPPTEVTNKTVQSLSAPKPSLAVHGCG